MLFQVYSDFFNVTLNIVETKHFHSIWLLHVVVGDGGFSELYRTVFTDNFFVYDFIWSYDHGF